MPIQKAVLRLFMDKPNDIVAHAQTGSGKSAAYLLPLIHQIHKIKSQYREGINRDSPYALVLLPTKELAIQIYNDAVAFSMGTLTRPVLCYGGYDYQSNREDIHKGCDMIFCTVGRLMGLIKDGTINIGKVIYFILDEADKLINTTEDFLVHVKYLKENM
uniref:ATP-dependent RNA helicase n=1 Tax=Acrobeloides nanus TaxID=290746 RepID=A0A914D3U8_9BILA